MDARPGLGLECEEASRRRRALLTLLLGIVLLVPSTATAPDPEAASPALPWVVQGAPDSLQQVLEQVEAVGGHLTAPLPIVEGAAVRLTPAQAATLAAHPAVRSVTPDAQVQLSGLDWLPSDEGSVTKIAERVLGADHLWRQGVDGEGVDVALIDSGVAPVPGLDDPDKLVYGADLSFDSQLDDLRYLDLFGHGTHMASIIAGNDEERRGYRGIAPGARLVSVKVADGAGRADVSQVIAAIDWVVQHRSDEDLDIRVLLLAFGTDSTQDPAIDPLSHAAQVAWRHGIVVVVAAGNDGTGAALRNPAHDPYVLAVGAVQSHGTKGTGDDEILESSNCGTEDRPVDLLAPGKSVLGLRVPGSFIDTFHPGGAVGERLFRGTGSSQAAAVTTGAVALLLDHRPDLTPDQVKALLTSTASPLRATPEPCEQAGVLDLGAAAEAPAPDEEQDGTVSTGLGSLEDSRGSHHVDDGEEELSGEVDIFGVEWDAEAWAEAASDGESWDGGSWNGSDWTGDEWTSNSWSSNSWSSNSWSSNSWSSNSWSSNSWSSNSWSTDSWSTDAWR